jgi:hypothetical protein
MLRKIEQHSVIEKLTIALLLSSSVMHILILLQHYVPGLIPVLTLTMFMFLAWLYSSKRLKALPGQFPGENPWRLVFKKSPAWLRYFVIFLLLYAVINFVMSIKIDTGSAFYNTTIPYYKLRGISGFWIAFFGLAYLVQRMVRILTTTGKDF